MENIFVWIETTSSILSIFTSRYRARKSPFRLRALITFLLSLFRALVSSPTSDVGITSNLMFLFTLRKTNKRDKNKFTKPWLPISSKAPGAPHSCHSPLHRLPAQQPRWAPLRAPCHPRGRSIDRDDDYCSPAAPAGRKEQMDGVGATLPPEPSWRGAVSAPLMPLAPVTSAVTLTSQVTAH